jgi:hypothetical protein
LHFGVTYPFGVIGPSVQSNYLRHDFKIVRSFDMEWALPIVEPISLLAVSQGMQWEP